MKISVCICSIRTHTLPYTVRAVQAQSFTDWELVIVLQGEFNDPTLLALAAADERIRVVHDSGIGKSRALNLAVAAADGDILALTDDDCEPEVSWLAAIHDVFTREPRLGLLGGSVIAGPKQRRGISACPEFLALETRYDPATDTIAPDGFDWIGANVAVTRWAAAAAGPFDPCLGPGARFRGGEDIEYKLRVECAAVGMGTTPASVVHHTYGRRYGIRAVWLLFSGYASGTGAIVGKLTLMGDSRGENWVPRPAGEFRKSLKRPWLVVHGARAALRARYFRAGFRDMVREYRYDENTGTLLPAEAGPRRNSGRSQAT